MKAKTTYRCENCQYQTAKWIGRCPDCLEWNTFLEASINKSASILNSDHLNKAKKISDITHQAVEKIKTNIYEFDRVLGKGITPSSLVLIGGEPGVGKSTLLMQVCKELTKRYKILYISGEESEQQVAARAKRLKIFDENFYIINEANLEAIVQIIKTVNPIFLVIDSIQTMYSEEIQSTPGSVAQVREVTHQFMNIAKKENLTIFVVGHITKEGGIAGPKTLEHMVDTVIYFEGHKSGSLRTLRAIKNRFGNTNEIGIFEMNSVGLKSIEEDTLSFISDKNCYPGKALTCVLEGNRSLIVEIQALVVENKFGNGKRIAQGFELNRLNLIIAIIEKYFEIPLSLCDIYLNISGGLQLKTRESDLAVLVALLSSHSGELISNSTLFLGELGLSGEIRESHTLTQRLNEAERLGYKKAITGKQKSEELKQLNKLKIVSINNAKEVVNYF